MSPTISAGTYTAATHEIDLTITDVAAGTLEVWRDQTRHDGVRQTQRIALVDHDGDPLVVTDYWAAHGEQDWVVFLDGVEQASTTATITMTADWLLSLVPESTSRTACIVAEGERVSRRRRGWWGTIVGTRRTVALTDVAMGAAEGSWEVWCPDTTTRDTLERLLDEGTIVLRSPRPRLWSGPVLVEEWTRDPVGADDAPQWRVEVRWVETWPVGVMERMPDEEEFT